MDFTGKVALITGGGGGIGRATALAFALRGAKVMVVDHDAAAGQASADIVIQRGGNARFTQADVTRSAAVADYVKATLDAYGRIDCFFNNAGIEGTVAPTQDYDEAVFDRVIAVNLKGVFLGMKHVLPVMLAQGSGAIVNTASVAGLFGGPGMAPYVASKHGVIGLTKVASSDVAAGRAGQRGLPGTGGNAHDAVAGSAAESERSGGGTQSLQRQHTVGPLHPAGRGCECGAVSVLRPFRQRHRHPDRDRWRPFRIRRSAPRSALMWVRRSWEPVAA